MSRCNLEIFDPSFTYRYHDTIETPSIDDDYLVAGTSSIDISKYTKIDKHSIVRINGDVDFNGVVESVEQKEYVTTVHFSSFVKLFDRSVLFDTDWQDSSKTLESAIADVIKQYWVNSSDSVQNYTFLDPVATSSTTNWTFNLRSDSEESHYCIINLYDAIVTKALTKYGIAINAEVDYGEKKVHLYIGKISGSFYLDADLPHVEITSIVDREPDLDYNKLEIWNTKNYTEKIYYYLYQDGTYGIENKNRISPVVLEVVGVEEREESEEVDTGETDEDGNPIYETEEWLVPFSEVAREYADSTFGEMTWKNNIELEVLNQDTLINPIPLKFGQQVKILSDDQTYESILTGKKIGTVSSLIFGSVRNEYTKKKELERQKADSDEKTTTGSASTSSSSGRFANDYTNLINKPKIEGVTLEGNKSFAQLGVSPITSARIDAICV